MFDHAHYEFFSQYLFRTSLVAARALFLVLFTHIKASTIPSQITSLVYVMPGQHHLENCGNCLYLYGGCENSLNWKNAKSPATGSDCKVDLLVVEEYSPAKPCSFQWGAENIRRKKVQQKGHMKEKALIH